MSFLRFLSNNINFIIIYFECILKFSINFKIKRLKILDPSVAAVCNIMFGVTWSIKIPRIKKSKLERNYTIKNYISTLNDVALFVISLRYAHIYN